jgi:ABC-type lipoprotein export system ATPase subunit
LRGITLGIDAGELVVIKGRSGSGKSTLLNVLGLLTRPDSGTIYLNGVERAALSDTDAALARRDSLGFVFQSYNLLPHLSALENVCLAIDGTQKQARGQSLEALYRVGLTNRAKHLPNELSGGEQQRVAVARALVRKPSVVLADEPTGNLDATSEELVLGELRRATTEGCAVVVVSHSSDVSKYADRLIEIADGVVYDPESGDHS